MAYVATQHLLYPSPIMSAVNVIALTSSVIDAAGEKFAWIGSVSTPNRGSKNIQTVGFLPGAITSAGGSTMRVSLQDVDLTTGAPIRPDGTQDQTVDFLASAATANTWYQTGNLSGTRAVTHGDYLAVVIEYQSFAGSDAFNLTNIATASTFNKNFGTSLYTTSWAQVSTLPNIILGFDDGTFGSLGPWSHPVASLTTDLINTGTTPDEVALRFSVPFACKIDGGWANLAPNGAARDFNVVLYEGTTSLVSKTIDSDAMSSTTAGPISFGFAEQTLTPNTVYYLAILPTTASNTTVHGFTVSDANHFGALPGGTEFHFASRTNAGAWSATTTKRPWIGINISALSDGAGGSTSSGVVGA